jgi:hypothetical protein
MAQMLQSARRYWHEVVTPQRQLALEVHLVRDVANLIAGYLDPAAAAAAAATRT